MHFNKFTVTRDKKTTGDLKRSAITTIAIIVLLKLNPIILSTHNT